MYNLTAINTTNIVTFFQVENNILLQVWLGIILLMVLAIIFMILPYVADYFMGINLGHDYGNLKAFVHSVFFGICVIIMWKIIPIKEEL